MGAASSGRPRGRADGSAANAALLRRLVEDACNRGDLAVLDEMPCAGVDESRARLRDLLAAFRDAAPDARWTIVEQVAQGDTVVTRLAVRGTFAGPLLGLAPPGRPATLTGVAFSRFAEGRLVDLWLQADLLGFLQELRILPPLDLTQALAMARVARAGALLVGDAGRGGRPRVAASLAADAAERTRPTGS